MKNLKHKTLVLFPTAAEAEQFIAAGPEKTDVAIIGVGPIEAAVNTLVALRGNGGGYSKVILAGIAGRYPGGTLAPGDVVLVEVERDADCGSFSGGTFSPQFAKNIKCPYLPSASTLRRVRSNSVSAAGAPFVESGGGGGDAGGAAECGGMERVGAGRGMERSEAGRGMERSGVGRGVERSEAGRGVAEIGNMEGIAERGATECGAEIENMEGAAFFRACLCSLAGGIEFFEIRAVSNTVGEDISKWNIPLALKNLTEELSTLCFLFSSELSENEPDALDKCDINSYPELKNDLR